MQANLLGPRTFQTKLQHLAFAFVALPDILVQRTRNNVSKRGPIVTHFYANLDKFGCLISIHRVILGAYEFVVKWK